MRAIVEAVKRDGKAFKGTDGEWYSTRNAACASLVRGQEVEFENEKKGRWNNIVDNRITVVGGGDDRPAPTGKAGSSTPPKLSWSAYNDKDWQAGIQRSIGRQNALTNAVNAMGPVEGVANMDRYLANVLKAAETFAKWTAGRDRLAVLEDLDEQNPAPTPPPTVKAPQSDPTPAPAPAAAPAADFDDDITF